MTQQLMRNQPRNRVWTHKNMQSLDAYTGPHNFKDFLQVKTWVEG